MQQSNATYSLKNWDRRPWHVPSDKTTDLKLYRIELTYRYEGVIEGESTAQYLMSQKGDKEVNFVALEKVAGSVDGKSGTFVFQRIGTSDHGGVIETVTVLRGSGTGDLTGLRGQITIEHTGHQETFPIRFEYQLE